MKKLILCLTFMIILVSISSNVYAEEKIDVLICFKDKVNQKVIESLGGKTDKILKNQPILLGKLPKTQLKN